MTKTDVKDIYPIFKFFKDNYSILNKATYVLMRGLDDRIILYFANDNKFFLLYGELIVKNSFVDWLKNKTVAVTSEDVVLLHKCLKKNVISIDETEYEYILTFDDKENTKHTITLTDVRHPLIIKIDNILNKLNKEYFVNASDLSHELFIPYENQGCLTFDHNESNDKILEYPSKKFLSLQKDAQYSLSISNRTGLIRYVSLNSKTDNVILKQIFATI